MSIDSLLAIATSIMLISAFLLGAALIVMQFYVKVDQGNALIVNTLKSQPEVTFTGRIVYPVIHKKEIMNIALKTIVIDRRGKEGLICRDNIRADIKVTFFVRVNKTEEDVLKVAQIIGCARASEQETLEELFNAKFSEALKTVGKQLDFTDLYKERDQFRDKILAMIGKDLNGYVLDDAAIDYLEQTPLQHLDANNILDAQGIRKITELTAEQHVLTNELQRREETLIKKQDVEAREKILEQDRLLADVEARQMREIAAVRAREEAERKKIEAEELQKAEQARILAEQEIAIQEENKRREIEVAGKNRERALAIENEKVERVRQLEVISREKEVALEEIAKEKALEVEKKHIADVVRERIVVDKTVAEEEENIKQLRVVAEADRQRKVQVIQAEAQAEQDLVKEIKAAEAAEKTAVMQARQRLTLAEAEREAAVKQAEAQTQLASGLRETEAAKGLAEAKVQEAKAIAHEKEGLAQAKVVREKMLAEAAGLEEQGMAKVRVKDADAGSEEQQQLVQIKVKIAEAEAIAKHGEAEAKAILERLQAESQGLAEKFSAMQGMSAEVRAHEEFRMQLDNAHAENLKAIAANTEIAAKQAEVFAQALKQANIDIVGGDGQFLDSFVKSLSVGKAIDGAIGKSDVLQNGLAKLLGAVPEKQRQALLDALEQAAARSSE
ncbi:MAG: hypothetical protein ACU837_12160 [Gammaproteobacteria bacterium]